MDASQKRFRRRITRMSGRARAFQVLAVGGHVAVASPAARPCGAGEAAAAVVVLIAPFSPR